MTTSLAPSVKDRVATLLWLFEDIIALNDNDLGRTNLASHRIDIAGARPVRQPPPKITKETRNYYFSLGFCIQYAYKSNKSFKFSSMYTGIR